MKILIAGAGRLGAQIAHVLAAGHNQVTIIDIDQHRLAELGGQLTARLLPGDACEPAVLEEAGVHTADLLLATTGDDEDNLVISLLAKRQFAVPRVVARVNDSDNTWLFDSAWGVDVAVPAATPLISLIEEATGATDTVALLRLSKAGVNVIETAISATSRAAGHPLSDVHLPPGSVVAAVIRHGQPTVPAATFRLQPGDEILVVSENATELDVHSAFQ
jgi:trk system potassium uptake protein TrkA